MPASLLFGELGGMENGGVQRLMGLPPLRRTRVNPAFVLLCNVRTGKVSELGRIVVAAVWRDDVQVVATGLGELASFLKCGFRRLSPVHQFTVSAHALNGEGHLSFFSFSFSGL